MKKTKGILISYLKNKIGNWISVNPNIISNQDTINILNENKYSLSRFGDGEFNIIWGNDIGFQCYNESLANRLKYILKKHNKKILIGIPDSFENLDKFEDEPKKFWEDYMATNKNKIIKLLNMEKMYCDSFITRFYLPYKYKYKSSERILQIKKIWQGRKIVFVEGSLTRMGIGNDLFDNVANIRRILVPVTNAFSLYNDILNECLNIDKDYLFILSIGPTASVLSYDLSEYGYQALDLGHIDLQYEYYLRKCCEKIKIIGKYNNEIDNGDKVEMINDEDYSNQIIKRIGC
ncbi:SP_1767 family glycosyltransferase [Terrisporobacter glycolicus]|uniref:Glycosyltransferase GlyD n=1 Tax=Terrisporobacter glycolicus ATCC 14880 = DSM 1288 TaxID=1121315 RepID=A0ABZ2ES41_9FIRM|nr:SP_1767 family glycosyltransferase [Terrisporobacter glycolicus]